MQCYFKLRGRVNLTGTRKAAVLLVPCCAGTVTVTPAAARPRDVTVTLAYRSSSLVATA